MIQHSNLQIIESEHLVEDGAPIKISRPWKERLFSRPWKPFESIKTIIPKVPMKNALVYGNKILVHPKYAAQIKI